MSRPDHEFPQHILMTADSVGGVWTYAMELCAALARRGVRVSLATMGDRLKEHQRADAASIPKLDVYESQFRLEWMDDPWGDVAAAGHWLLSLQQSTGADLVHLNGYAHAALPWRVPVVVVAHSCVLSWWRAVRGEDAPATYGRYRHRVTQGVRSADAVAAPTAWMLEQVKSLYGPIENALAVWNARSGTFHPANKEPFVFSCGRVWDEAKNIAALCSVAPLLKWPVAIAGDTRHPNGSQIALSRVELLGRLQQAGVADWLSRASIYALPAYYEPFGLSVLEAALSGCALVLGDIGSLREIWGEDALFVSPDDEMALVRVINRLIEDSEQRADLGARARRRAMQFTGERMLAGYADVYAAARRRFATVIGSQELLAERICV